MTTIREMLERVRSVNLVEELGKVVMENKEQVLNLEKGQLYNESQRSDGRPLNPYKNKAYALKKNKMHPEVGYGKPDFFLKGDWQRKMTLKVNDGVMTFDNDSDTTQWLIKRDGKEIMGLSEESKGGVVEIVHDPFIQNLSEITGIQMG